MVMRLLRLQPPPWQSHHPLSCARPVPPPFGPLPPGSSSWWCDSLQPRQAPAYIHLPPRLPTLRRPPPCAPAHPDIARREPPPPAASDTPPGPFWPPLRRCPRTLPHASP